MRTYLDVLEKASLHGTIATTQGRRQSRRRSRLQSPKHAMRSIVASNTSSYMLALMSMEDRAMTSGTRALCITVTAVHLQLDTFRAWVTGRTKEQQQRSSPSRQTATPIIN